MRRLSIESGGCCVGIERWFANICTVKVMRQWIFLAKQGPGLALPMVGVGESSGGFGPCLACYS